MKKVKSHLKLSLAIVCMGIGLYGPIKDVRSQIPTTTISEGVQIPDFSQLTFSNLPPLPSSGSVPQQPLNVIESLGYDPSRLWNAGDAVANVVSLGDFQEAFRLQEFQLDQILGITGFIGDQFSLADAGFLQTQSIADVVGAIGLENFTPSQIAPLGDLLSASGVSGVIGNETFGELLNNPQVANILQTLELGQIDLSQYGLDAIPGLSSTQLSQFPGWQGALISQVPGLSDVPFDQFPNAINLPFTIPIAKFDVPYGTAEAQRIDTVTGSYQEGFAVPCNQSSCAYLELTDAISLGPLASMHGKQWIAGASQQVQGGTGYCSGTEPTGRHPFGASFKVVLENVVESEGRGDFYAYFSLDCGFGSRTPYIFPLFPLPSVYEKDNLIIGF